MVITEAELREMWRDGRNSLPSFPPGTRFSPSAQDFLKAHGLQITFSTGSPFQPSISNAQLPPRLLARLNTLHATLLLAGAHARRFRLPELAARLANLADLCAGIGGAQVTVPEAQPSETGTPLTPAGLEDHEILLWLNLARVLAQEIELEASADGAPPYVPAALGKLRAALNDLDRQFRAGKLAWKLPD